MDDEVLNALIDGRYATTRLNSLRIDGTRYEVR